jgi:hypothetical protein
VSQQDDTAEAAMEDLNFLQWVKEAATAEIMGQFKYAMGWQKVAIERELRRRFAA